MHAAPGPSWSSAYTHTEAEIASAGAALWSGASLASDYSSLQDALFSPAEGSSKKRKVHDLDPESDVEDVSGAGTSTSKKRKVQDTCPAMPVTNAGDVLELIAGPKKRSKRRSTSETKAVKAEGSKRIRNGHKDGVEALRQSQKLYPEAPKKKPTKAEVLRTGRSMMICWSLKFD
ncbi:hypothetical protein EWM64_g7598 [Hericium alpestre]|uniref:Uncharacterized protein n=1 Tax=Hericium alpestre TaxID=135208 RepID=A0A4Y9ZQ75_9AGAM|nr:hypothetical protein EWM64_g7598 [Hericium alpestre]